MKGGQIAFRVASSSPVSGCKIGKKGEKQRRNQVPREESHVVEYVRLAR